MQQILETSKLVNNQKLNICAYKYVPKYEKYYICDKVKIVPSCKNDFIKMKVALTKKIKRNAYSQGDIHNENERHDICTVNKKKMLSILEERNCIRDKEIINIHNIIKFKNKRNGLSSEELKIKSKEGLNNMKLNNYSDFKRKIFHAKSTINTLKQKMVNVLEKGKDDFLTNNQM